MSKSDQKLGKSGEVGPQWDVAHMQRRTRNLLSLWISVLTGIWALAILWILFVAPIRQGLVNLPPAGTDLLLLLAPIIVASLAIERILEAIFNLVESKWVTLVAYLGHGLRWLKSTVTEVALAQQWFQVISAINNDWTSYNRQQVLFFFGKFKDDTGNVLGQDGRIKDLPAEELSPLTGYWSSYLSMHDDSQRIQKIDEARRLMLLNVNDLRGESEKTTAWLDVLLKDAQRRLSMSEASLAGATSPLRYRIAKSLLSIELGLLLGVIVAALAQIQIFAFLGIPIAARIDVLITGLVIGGASYIMHLFISLVLNIRDLLHNWSSYLNQSAAMKELEVQARKAEADARQKQAEVALAAAARQTSVIAEVSIGGNVVGRDSIDTKSG